MSFAADPRRWPYSAPAPSRRLDRPVDPALEADRVGLALCLARERTTLPLALAARFFSQAKGWFELGYARLEDHARERFGRSGRWVRDLASLAEAVEALPDLEKAMTGEDGGPPIGRVVALLVGRTANPRSCSEWVRLARALPVREFREEIRRAGLAGSSRPVGAPSTDPGLDVTGEVNPASSDPIAAGEDDAASSDTIAADAGALNKHARGFSACSNPPSSVPFNTDAAVSSIGSLSDAAEQDDPTAPTQVAGGAVGPNLADTPELEERCTIRFALPPPVLAALDEARDLHGAICGGDTGLASFIEALTAETVSGSCEPLHDDAPFRRRLPKEIREADLARASDNWEFLRRKSSHEQVLQDAKETILEVDRLCHAASASARGAEELVRKLTRLEDELERQLGQVLAMMSDIGAVRGLSFAGVGHYAEARLGISRTTAEDRARLARALRPLPVVRAAYERGRLGFQAASLICRVLAGRSAHPRLQARWVKHAERTTIKRLRDEMRLRSREKIAQPTAMAAPPVDDATWHRSLSRRPGDAIARVEEYGRLSLEADRWTVVVPMRLPADLAAQFLGALSAKRRWLEKQVKAGLAVEPFPLPLGTQVKADIASGTDLSSSSGLPASHWAARAFSLRCGVVPQWVAMLAMIEEFVATWDDPRHSPERDADRIYIRDGWRCAAPGCISRRNLEEHHVEYRSRGGSNEMSNRICLCRFHHQRGEHGDLMTCRGEAPLALVWRMGRSGRGGDYENERLVNCTLGWWRGYAR